MSDTVTAFHVFHYATHSWVWGVTTVVAPGCVLSGEHVHTRDGRDVDAYCYTHLTRDAAERSVERAVADHARFPRLYGPVEVFRHGVDDIEFPQAVCIDAQPHAKHRIAGTWRDQCPGLEEDMRGLPATAEVRDVPAFTPIRVAQADPGAVVLGLVDHEGIVHTFTPEAGFARTLATRHAGKAGWWRLTFNDGYQLEALGFELLAVTGQAPAGTVTDQTATDNDDQE